MLAAHLPLNATRPALVFADAATNGAAIAITGMLIVACALILICLFIMSLPKVLAAVATVWPESDEPHPGPTHPESLVPDDDSVLAAIGFVLHHRLRQGQNSGQSDRT